MIWPEAWSVLFRAVWDTDSTKFHGSIANNSLENHKSILSPIEGGWERRKHRGRKAPCEANASALPLELIPDLDVVGNHGRLTPMVDLDPPDNEHRRVFLNTRRNLLTQVTECQNGYDA